MDLGKAINIIKDIDTLDDTELQEAYNTVLQALDRLQKENKILQSIKYATANCLDIEKIKTEECERWKDKIREKIKELEEQEKAELGKGEVIVLPKDTAYLAVKAEYYHKKEVLKDLLKEE